MKKIIFAMLAGFALHSAMADDFDAKQCSDRCATAYEEHPEESLRHAAALKAIRARREGVSDPAVLKQLQEAEDDEIEKHQDKGIKMCRYICYKTS